MTKSEKKILGDVFRKILTTAQPYGMGWLTEFNYEFSDEEKKAMEKFYDSLEKIK